jgi:hypothetical protein
MKKIIIGISLFICFVTTGYCSVNKDFKIDTPNNWIDFPKDVLDQYSEMLSKSSDLNETYEYGYQIKTAENWFTYPYALVQVKRNGRVSEGQLKQYKEIETEMIEGIKKAEESMVGLVSGISQSETLYESNKKILWSVLTMDVTDIGHVKGIIAVKLTEYGFIQFMGYALEEDFNKYLPIYKKMAKSITVNDADIYKPRITDNAPVIFGINLGQTAITAIIGAFIGGLVGLFFKFRRKNS